MDRRRRHLLFALAGACLPAFAQRPARVPVAGWMMSGSSDRPELIIDVTRAFRDLGYRDGQVNVVALFAEGKRERLDGIAAELVAMKPDVIFAGATAGTLAAKRATSTIPIVFAGVSDPVGAGFVESLARPGRNITGIANFAVDTAGKPFEILHAVVPKTRRIAVLGTANPGMDVVLEAKRKVARERGLALRIERAETLAEVEAAIAAFRKWGAEALVVLSDGPAIVHRVRLAELAAAARLPAIYSYAMHVEAGGLMSYGPNPDGLVEQIVGYMDRILKGARPADLPVQGPRSFELALNRDAARALGLTFPRELLLRADRIVGKE